MELFTDIRLSGTLSGLFSLILMIFNAAMSENDLSSQIEEAAVDPQSFSTDGQSISARPLSDLIEADKHLAKKAAAASRSLPIHFGRIRPPGAI